MTNTDQPRGHVEPDGSVHNGKFTKRKRGTPTDTLLGERPPASAPFEFRLVDGTNLPKATITEDDGWLVCPCGNGDWTTGPAVRVEPHTMIPHNPGGDVPEYFQARLSDTFADDEKDWTVCTLCSRVFENGPAGTELAQVAEILNSDQWEASRLAYEIHEGGSEDADVEPGTGAFDLLVADGWRPKSVPEQ